MKVIQFLTCSYPQQVTQQKHVTVVDKIVLDPSCRGELAHYTKNMSAQFKEQHESKRFKFVHLLLGHYKSIISFWSPAWVPSPRDILKSQFMRTIMIFIVKDDVKRRIESHNTP